MKKSDLFISDSSYPNGINFVVPKSYKLDLDKVKTVDDIKQVLELLDIVVYDNYKHFDKFKHLLKDN